jgi:uncharacterized protein YydD (DUF2326 family)
MIRRLFSSDTRFKTLRFRPGINVVLADKSPGATDRDTRNGAGKSSIIELIHFLLGADAEPNSIFRDAALCDEHFGMDFDLRGTPVTVLRRGTNHGRVFFPTATDTSAWAIQPDKDLDGLSMRVEAWNVVLGEAIFGLRPMREEERTEKFGPSFRALICYFIRRAKSGGFDFPHAIHRKQPLWQQQVCVAFLLGLDWTIPQAMERIRSKERLRRQIRKMLREEEAAAGTLTDVLPSSAQLRTLLTLAESRAAKLRDALASFRVLEEYHVLEREVNEITQKLATLADENTFDRQVIAELQEAMNVESAPDTGQLEKVYEEAGLILPDRVRQRFDDVRAFHESVVKNRRAYLQGELTAANERIRVRSAEQEHLDARRSKIMDTLRSAGALDSFTALQEEFARVQAGVEHLRGQFERARQFEDTGREVAVERSQLEQRMVQNHREQQEQIDRAVLLFADVSRRLYREAGRLTISDNMTGEPVTIDIPRKASEGVSAMQIFCFDITMLELCRERGRGPDFLVHDSHLFDGVDDRQIRHAMEVATSVTEQYKFQYITTMNSDIGGLIQAPEFNLAKFVVHPRLSDLENEGLFGRRFGDTAVAQ